MNVHPENDTTTTYDNHTAYFTSLSHKNDMLASQSVETFALQQICAKLLTDEQEVGFVDDRPCDDTFLLLQHAVTEG